MASEVKPVTAAAMHISLHELHLAMKEWSDTLHYGQSSCRYSIRLIDDIDFAILLSILRKVGPKQIQTYDC